MYHLSLYIFFVVSNIKWPQWSKQRDRKWSLHGYKTTHTYCKELVLFLGGRSSRSRGWGEGGSYLFSGRRRQCKKTIRGCVMTGSADNRVPSLSLSHTHTVPMNIIITSWNIHYWQTGTGLKTSQRQTQGLTQFRHDTNECDFPLRMCKYVNVCVVILKSKHA